MKMNFKRIAAVMMVLVLAFSLSVTAFASNVYSNIIIVNAIEKPVEEEVVVEETPAEDEVVVEETPAEDEVVVEETPAEEEVVVEETPAEDEVVVEETPAEDEVVVEETPAEEEVVVEETPAEDEVVVEETPAEDEVVVEETPAEEEVVEEVPAIDVDALLADVTVTVECELICKGTAPNFGDDVQLTATVTGADDFEYELIWEYNIIDEDEEDEWTADPELVGNVVTFTLTLDNYMTEWRARLVPVLPETAAE